MQLDSLGGIGRLSDRIYDILKAKILAGQLAPGYHLALEEIARGLGVSTTPVRDALNLLAADGLVEWQPRRGAFVTRLTAKTVEDLYQVREFLECAAIECATTRRTVPVSDMERLLERVAAVLAGQLRDNIADCAALEIRFHTLPVASVGNDRLTAIYSGLASTMTIAFVLYCSEESRLREALAEHQAIVEALRRYDGQAARSALREHLQRSKDAIMRHVSRNTPV